MPVFQCHCKQTVAVGPQAPHDICPNCKQQLVEFVDDTERRLRALEAASSAHAAAISDIQAHK